VSKECGAYATGGNYSGFKQIKDKAFNFGFPIAEIEDSGHYIVTKNCAPGLNGIVNVDTIRSQILYEIQGNVSGKAFAGSSLSRADLSEP
jgi:hypothetical protein